MKQKYIIIVIFCIVLLLAIHIKPIVYKASDVFWKVIGQQLDKEEQERMRQMENGELIRGKDTILIWKNRYEIGHFPDGDHLSLKTEESQTTLLRNVKKYMKKEGKLYLIAEDGYAVINEENCCDIFLKKSRENEKLIIQDVKILSSYEEFSRTDKEVFEKMMK